MIMFILAGILIVIGINTVQGRYESDGLFKALKSLFCLALVAVAIGLCMSGVGAIAGIPIAIWAKQIAKGI